MKDFIEILKCLTVMLCLILAYSLMMEFAKLGLESAKSGKCRQSPEAVTEYTENLAKLME